MLKSPSMMSIEWFPRSVSFCFIFLQKSGCLWWAFGAYIFSIINLYSLCHLSVSSSALPGMSSVIVASCDLMLSLFITKATPADAPGFVGFCELCIDSHLPYRFSIVVMWCASRWVSCRQSIPIRCWRSVLCTSDHLDIGSFVEVDQADRPFMFSVAMSMFARDLGFPFWGSQLLFMVCWLLVIRWWSSLWVFVDCGWLSSCRAR